MEKKSWLWKRKSSDRSPGETESSTSISSHSESNSDEKVEQDSSRKSANHMQSSEVTSKISSENSEVSDSFKSLTDKLSAALVNVGAKEDLVKQHAKVAEEAVAGWEKAENEVTTLRQQLEAAVQQNLALEVRTNHLDGALKECLKELRQAREEHEQRLNEIIEEKTHEWELTKSYLEIQLSNLQSNANKSKYPVPADPNTLLKLETLEKENSALKFELAVQSEELELRTIERDLSTQAAEAASKQQLESIKRVAKLEAECRKLQSLARKSPSVNDHRAVSISSFYVDSLTDSQSDSAEKLNALDMDSFKLNKLDHNENCSDSWALALMNELDQFKSGKCVAKNAPRASVEINNMMDDFLEMERIASLSEGQNEICNCTNSETEDNSLKTELEVMGRRVVELEEKLQKLEAEKAELESALNATKESLSVSNAQLEDTRTQMDGLRKELNTVNESKELLESRLVNMEAEARVMSAEVDSIKTDVEKERTFSSEMTIKCQRLEKELVRKTEEFKVQLAANSNGELKVKQDLEVAAADRLSECQKTISSLARQLESLATLEDFLIDTANLPGFSGGSSVPKTGVELWKLHSNDTFMPKKTLIPTKQTECNNGDEVESPPSSSSSSTSSAVSLNHFGGHSKSKNSFEKLFSRSKNGNQGESHSG